MPIHPTVRPPFSQFPDSPHGPVPDGVAGEGVPVGDGVAHRDVPLHCQRHRQEDGCAERDLVQRVDDAGRREMLSEIRMGTKVD